MGKKKKRAAKGKRAADQPPQSKLKALGPR
jgi:hypothetical protein